MNHYKQFALAVAAEPKFDRNANYLCPAGYQWATYEQVVAVMTGKVEPTVPYYTNMCGWEDNEWPEGGDERQYFFFKNSLDDDQGEYLDASSFEGTWQKQWGGGSADGIGLEELRTTTEEELFAGIGLEELRTTTEE